MNDLQYRKFPAAPILAPLRFFDVGQCSANIICFSGLRYALWVHHGVDGSHDASRTEHSNAFTHDCVAYAILTI